MYSIARVRGLAAIRTRRNLLQSGSISYSTNTSPPSHSSSSWWDDLNAPGPIDGEEPPVDDSWPPILPQESAIPKRKGKGKPGKSGVRIRPLTIRHILKTALQNPPFPLLPRKQRPRFTRLGVSIPAPLLNKKEIDRYLNPLYAKLWDVKFEAAPPNSKIIKVIAVKPLWLGKRYPFPTSAGAFAFMRRFMDVVVEEHHPPFRMAVEGCTAIIHISSRRGVMPGLSLSDVRLAVGSDLKYEDELSAGRAIPMDEHLRSEIVSTKSMALAESWDPKNLEPEGQEFPLISNTLESSGVKAEALPSLSLIPDDKVPLNDNEDNQYLIPLHTQQWTRWVPPHAPTITGLSKQIRFQDLRSVIPFLKVVTEHGSTGNPLFVLTYTNNAVRLSTNIIRDSGHDRITHADVREAIRLETMIQEYTD